MKGDKECEEHNCEALPYCSWHPDECQGKPWGSLYEINCEPEPEPGPGRRRLEITCKEKGVVVWHKAGPSNIVLGLYRKFLETRKGREFVMDLGCRGDVHKPF